MSTDATVMAGDQELPGFGGHGGAGRRPCLLIVDATVAFTDPASPLACECEDAVAAMRDLLRAARAARAPVVYTTVVLGAGQRRAAAHFLRKMPALLSIGDDPAASRIDPRLDPLPDEPVLEKIFPSAFFGTGLPSILAAAAVDTVIVTGMSTSGCVRASAVDALQHGYAPIVAREAVADRDQRAHENSLRDLELKYADVVVVAEVAAYLERCARAEEASIAGTAAAHHTTAGGADGSR